MPKFEPLFTHNFLQEQAYWVLTKPETAAKINTLVAADLKEPFQGIGKPEPLLLRQTQGLLEPPNYQGTPLGLFGPERYHYVPAVPLPLLTLSSEALDHVPDSEGDGRKLAKVANQNHPLCRWTCR